ncbi:hypothetical protein Skr01_07380 [Sphaerisporangium krabiense]|nr:hypothetical protein Skr01_07380 [Sphaerisporangium krabiense]
MTDSSTTTAIARRSPWRPGAPHARELPDDVPQSGFAVPDPTRMDPEEKMLMAPSQFRPAASVPNLAIDSLSSRYFARRPPRPAGPPPLRAPLSIAASRGKRHGSPRCPQKGLQGPK